ncbi:hypothetical protein [Amaricoccus sp.]|uniref:hypothetical protein n=1 Tax=Amaricoccus sp. TaxID=1872485 RepID=UPI001B5E6EA7|nr:hypothetical protein [Amaricoccus sp.]MBP7001096.1 hypothetical protein [Amaricoccus sp.]
MLTAEPDPTVPKKVLENYHSRSQRAHLAALRQLQQLQQAKLGRPARDTDVVVRVSRDAHVPQLAWLCVVSRSGYDFTLGSGVERGPRSIFEGVWDGDFAAHQFHRSQYVYGSGAVWNKYVIFVPPKHCWEYLYILTDRVSGKTFVSNSFNYAFAAAGVDTGDAFFEAVADTLFPSTNTASTLGIDLYNPAVCETERYALKRMMFYNFIVDPEGGVTLLSGVDPEAPYTTYAEYRAFLVGKIRDIRLNATDPGRSRPFPPITPVSRGYDSPCVAVLARDAGCNDAVTMELVVKGKLDSGTDIARKLGLNVHVASHMLGDEVPALAVAFEGDRRDAVLEFIATAGIGDDVGFLGFEEALRGRAFLIGAMGDSVWRRNSSLPPGLPVRVAYGKSITEFRLRTGFAFVPVPSIGARFPSRVKRMTRTGEMAPYTLWAPYDRPFPRRVVEEAGIARGEFGSSKSAASPTPKNRSALFRPAVEAMMRRYGRADGDAGPTSDEARLAALERETRLVKTMLADVLREVADLRAAIGKE